MAFFSWSLSEFLKVADTQKKFWLCAKFWFVLTQNDKICKKVIVCEKLNDCKPFCDKIYGNLMMKLISFSRCKMCMFAKQGSEVWEVCAHREWNMVSLRKLKVKHGKFALLYVRTLKITPKKYFCASS